MVSKDDIPEVAMCHVCGEPMKVIDVSELAKSLGYKVAEGSFALECCGFEQTIENAEEAKRVRLLLQAYHSERTPQVQ